MHKIGRLFAMKWQIALQYRMDTILWTLAQVATPLVAFMVWYRVATTSSTIFQPQEAIIYYILVAFMIMLTQSWAGNFLANSILKGDIVHHLTRPIGVFWSYIADNIMEKMFQVSLPLLILIGVWWYYSLGQFLPPVSWSQVTLCGLSIVLGMTIAFILDMTLGLIAFWLEDANQIRYLKYFLEELASGTLIPYAALPLLVFHIFLWLPFRYIISAPIEIIMGRTVQTTASHLISIQLIWVGVLVMVMAVMWRQGLKRYAPPGQ